MANNAATPVKVNYNTGDVLTAQNLDDEASAINRLTGFTTQATSAGTVTLTVSSNKWQEFTGTTASQVVQLPVTSTLGLGMAWVISNKSTQTIAVNSSGGNLIYTVPAATSATFTCNAITGATAASWSYDWSGSSAAPAGSKVLQVVMGTTTTSTSNSTVTYADTTLTATITPTLNTSKVLVLVSHNGVSKPATNSGDGVNIKLQRAGVDIFQLALYANYNNLVQVAGGSVSASYLDAPASTSALVYKTQFASTTAASSVTVQANASGSTIILMEIGA